VGLFVAQGFGQAFDDRGEHAAAVDADSPAAGE
jgi:hypothetical protein